MDPEDMPDEDKKEAVMEFLSEATVRSATCSKPGSGCGVGTLARGKGADTMSLPCRRNLLTSLWTLCWKNGLPCAISRHRRKSARMT